MAGAAGAPAPRAAAPARPGGLEAGRVGALLDALASAAPAPAGGAAAALAGALAGALCAMVARIAARHGGGRAALALARASADGDRLRRRLARLAAADSRAYARYAAARGRPAAPAAVERALAAATEAPVAVAEGARDVLGLCCALAPRARPSTRSDLAVAVHLARAALAAGAVTARANLGRLASPGARLLAGRLGRAERDGAALAEASLAALGGRAAGSPAAPRRARAAGPPPAGQAR